MNKFSVESPLFLLALIPVMGLILIFSLKKRAVGRAKIKKYVSAGLYLAAAGCAVCILAGLKIETPHAATSWVVLEDRSMSMKDAAERLEEDAETIERESGKNEYAARMVFADEASFLDGASDELKNFERPATDLANALYEAETHLKKNTKKRIILLSDGVETDGNAQTAAALLSHQGVRIDAVQYDKEWTEAECEVVGVEMPSEVVQGQSIRAKVTLKSNRAMSGKLKIYDEDVLVREDSIKIKEGINTYTYRLVPEEMGMRVFSAAVEPEQDGIRENNKNGTCVQVTGSHKVLLVDGTGAESGALYELLTQNGYDVTITAPKNVPRTAAAMCDYGLIVLMNVDALDLPSKTDEAFEQYVSTYGHSVLTTGGTQTYALGHMKDTAFETFLPVTMEVTEEEGAESVALLLVIDNSASMSETATNLANDTNTPCEMAKRGAIKSIGSLHDNDYVGVITFSDTYHILAPMTSVQEKDSVIAAVSRMGTISGTAYCEAFQAAYDMLSVFDKADKKHVLFISDGNPSDSGYESIVRQMAQAGITTSVIGIGSYVNGDIMEELAKIGGGYCTNAVTAKELPALMLSDTIIHQAEYEVNGTFDAKAQMNAAGVERSQSLSGVRQYIRVAAKREAQVLITVDGKDPLYVYEAYGKGKTAVWTSPMNERAIGNIWSEKGKQLLLNTVSALMPEESYASAFSVRMTGGGSTCTLEVSCIGLENACHVEAQVTTPEGNAYLFDLSQVRRGVFEKTFPVEGYGKYGCDLTVTDLQGDSVCEYQAAAVLLWSPEYEAFPDEEQKMTLREICELSGGAVYENADALMRAETDEQIIEYDPTDILAGIALACICAALLVRRIPERREKKQNERKTA